MIAEEFIKEHQGGVLLKDYILKDVEYFMEQYANQRVIEELEKQLENYFNQEVETYLSDNLKNRIKELKQD